MPADSDHVHDPRLPLLHRRQAASWPREASPTQEIDVSSDDAKRAWLVEATGRRTVPQIFIGDEPIGGYDELAALDKSGALAAKLK